MFYRESTLPQVRTDAALSLLGSKLGVPARWWAVALQQRKIKAIQGFELHSPLLVGRSPGFSGHQATPAFTQTGSTSYRLHTPSGVLNADPPISQAEAFAGTDAQAKAAKLITESYPTGFLAVSNFYP